MATMMMWLSVIIIIVVKHTTQAIVERKRTFLMMMSSNMANNLGHSVFSWTDISFELMFRLRIYFYLLCFMLVFTYATAKSKGAYLKDRNENIFALLGMIMKLYQFN